MKLDPDKAEELMAYSRRLKEAFERAKETKEYWQERCELLKDRLASAERERDHLYALLRKVEAYFRVRSMHAGTWTVGSGYCPCCGWLTPEVGHASDCEISKALRHHDEGREEASSE